MGQGTKRGSHRAARADEVILEDASSGRKPRVPAHSVCLECKRRGTVCIMVARGVPCLGPATQAGCGAICPAYNRGCYGCFGPMETPNPASLGAQFIALGQAAPEVARAFRGFNGYSPAFRAASEQFERKRGG